MSIEVNAASPDRTEPFTMIYNFVIDHYHLCPQELALYTVIARHINRKTGVAWPSYARLCALTGMARGTISKYLKSLESKRLIQITRRWQTGSKARATNLYRLLDPRRPAPDTPTPNKAPAMHDPAPVQDESEASSAREPGVVHGLHQGRSRAEPEVVHPLDRELKNPDKIITKNTDVDQRSPAQRAGSTHPAAPGKNKTDTAPPRGPAPQSHLSTCKEKGTWNQFCRALANVCQLDYHANQGKLRRFASLLWQHGQGYGMSDLATFEAWWYHQDWRGLKGDIPRLDEVVQMIRIAVEADQRAVQKAVEARYRYISGPLADLIDY
jgi:hypothetical protein